MELAYFVTQYLPTTWSIFNGSSVKNVYTDMPTDQEIISSLASVMEKFVTTVSSSALEQNIGLTTDAFDWVITDTTKEAVKQFLSNKGISTGDTKEEIESAFDNYYKDYRSRVETDIKNSIDSADREKKNAIIRLTKDTYKDILDVQRLQVEGNVTNNTKINKGFKFTFNKGDSISDTIEPYLRNDGYLGTDASVHNKGLTASDTYNSVTLGFIKNKVNNRYLPFYKYFGCSDDIFDFTDLDLTVTTDTIHNFTVRIKGQSTLGKVTGHKDTYGGMKGTGTTGYPNYSFTKPFNETTYEYSGSTYNCWLLNSMGSSTSRYIREVIDTFSPSFDSDFYEGMTEEEKLDTSNFQLVPYIVNNHYTTSGAIDITVADNVKESLIADTYDIVTVGSSDNATDRVNQDRLITIGTDTIGTIATTPADDVVDALDDALVYPVDTVEDKTLSPTQPITVPDAIDTIDKGAVINQVSEGNSYIPIVSPTGAYGLFTLYKIDSDNLKTLSKILWSADFITNFHPFQNNPQEALISLMAYPIDISADTSEHVIMCGNYSCSGVLGTASGNIVNNLFQEHSLGSVTVPKYFGNYMDYAPYTKVDLYLPFVGRVSLNPNEVMGAVLTITYRVELLTGTCAVSIHVRKDNLNGKLYQYTGNLAVSLPLSGSSFSQTYTNMVSSLVTMGAGFATGQYGMAVAGGAGLSNTMFENPQISNGGGMGGNSGMCGSMGAYLIITRAIPDIPDGYKAYKGVETNDNVVLNTLSGYVELDDYELSCPNITETEQDELNGLLKSGIII